MLDLKTNSKFEEILNLVSKYFTAIILAVITLKYLRRIFLLVVKEVKYGNN